MLQVLEKASEQVFVPLTVGGGIREYTEPSGRTWSSLEVAARYFRAGADKVSIGSDAVYAVEEFKASGGQRKVREKESAFFSSSSVYSPRLTPRAHFLPPSSPVIAHHITGH